MRKETNYEGEALAGPLKGKKLERVTSIPLFWFGWYAFHPTTELYRSG